jgi:alkylglycerol monooxygenase
MLNPILIAIPFFLLFMGLEAWAGRRQGQKLYKLHDTIANLSAGIGNQAFGLLSNIFLLALYVVTFQNFAFWELPVNIWTALGGFVLFDFLYYWAHRWSHEVNILWGAHIVHHQSEEYNLSVALRQSWVHNVLAFVIFLPMPLLGFDPMQFLGIAAFVTLYQFWIHTKAIDKMPVWFEFIFNTPSHHRVHHGSNPEYIDKNHAATFILWDRIFGTFQAEVAKPSYGITTRFESLNSAWANLHYYVEMWQLAKTADNWKDKLRVIWAAPGWTPKSQPATENEPVQTVVPVASNPHTPEPPASVEGYVLAQFGLVLLGLCAYMLYFDTMSWFYRILFFVGIILSVAICGGMLEQKRWVRTAEFFRIGLALLSLNTFYYYCYIDWFGVMVLGSAIGAVVSVGYFLIFVYKQLIISNLYKKELA